MFDLPINPPRPSRYNRRMTALLPYLRLLQLADSALPIGAAAHSFGLETLADEGGLIVDQLPGVMTSYLAQAGRQEAIFCHAAWRLADADALADGWAALNWRLAALKPARESRQASAVLGRRLLGLALELEPGRRLRLARELSRAGDAEPHHACVFGLLGGVLGVEPILVAGALLSQTLAGLVSACQRLLPLGQTRAQRLLWELKPAVASIAAATADLPPEEASCALPALELASMRHPGLATRLFVS